MRLIDADKLYPDCMTKDGKLAISQSQLANAPTVKPCDKCEELKAYRELFETPEEAKRTLEQFMV